MRWICFFVVVLLMVGVVSAENFEGIFYKIIITNPDLDDEFLYEIVIDNIFYSLDISSLNTLEKRRFENLNSGDRVFVSGDLIDNNIEVLSFNRISVAEIRRDGDGYKEDTHGFKKAAVVFINFKDRNFGDFFKDDDGEDERILKSKMMDSVNEMGELFLEESKQNIVFDFDYYEMNLDVDEAEGSSAGRLLQFFRNARNSCMGVSDNNLCEDYDVYIGITDTNLDGSTVGIAYVRVFGIPSVSYSINQHLASDLLMPILLAHETGHNLGLDHRPSGEDPRTIMYESLSVNNLPEFHAEDIEEMGWSEEYSLPLSSFSITPSLIEYTAQKKIEVFLRGEFPNDVIDCPFNGASLFTPLPKPEDSLNRPCLGYDFGYEINSWKNVKENVYSAEVNLPPNIEELPIKRPIVLTFYKSIREPIRYDSCPTDSLAIFLGSVLRGAGFPRYECPDRFYLEITDDINNHATITFNAESVRGDVNNDEIIDLSDAVGILTYLFLGENLECVEAGDVDGNGGVDIGDATYILNWLFLGGPGAVGESVSC
jgi:hypothetical protein